MDEILGAWSLVDRLAEDFASRCRNGDRPDISEYARAYPRHAQDVESLLPMVAMLEQFRRDLLDEQDTHTTANHVGD